MELSRIDELESRLEVSDLVSAAAPVDSKQGVKQLPDSRNLPSLEKTIRALQLQVASLVSELRELKINFVALDRSATSVSTTAPAFTPEQVSQANVTFTLESRIAALEAAAASSSSTVLSAATFAPVPVHDSDARSKADQKAFSRLESRVAVLESSRAPAAATSRPSAPTPSARAPVAPAPTPAGAPSYAQVVGRHKKAALTKEAIEKAADPAKLLLVKPRDFGDKTQEVLATLLKAPLTIEAQAKPYLAWKGLLKAKTGKTPLSMILISPRKCLAYWDVTTEDSLPELVEALWLSGFIEEQDPAALADKALRLRAYLASYFPILRRAALEGMDTEDRTWVLEKAVARWKSSYDKVAQSMSMKRIRRDKGDEADEVPLGESWSFTPVEKVNSLIASCERTSGDVGQTSARRRRPKMAVTSEVVGSELVEDVVMEEFRTSVKRGNSRPASVADDEVEVDPSNINITEPVAPCEVSEIE